MSIISCFLTTQNSTTNVGNHSVGVRNDNMCVCNTALNLGNGRMRIRNGGVSLGDAIVNAGNNFIYV